MVALCKVVRTKGTIMDDTVLVYCHTCDEEYHLPEDSVQCPVCSNSEIEEV